jgi:hypothetical protein
MRAMNTRQIVPGIGINEYEAQKRSELDSAIAEAAAHAERLERTGEVTLTLTFQLNRPAGEVDVILLEDRVRSILERSIDEHILARAHCGDDPVLAGVTVRAS